MPAYYHATAFSNLESILKDGLRPGIDHIVYLTESYEDSLKFLAIRLFDEDIVIIKIEGLDPDKVIETFDHSYSFFQCRSFGYLESIDPSLFTEYRVYPAKR